MKILMLSSENAPYAQVGGLSQAVSFLSRAVGNLGDDVRVFIPKYGIIDMAKYSATMDTEHLKVPTSTKIKKIPKELICNVLFCDKNAYGPPTYFLENQEYYELRANVYGYGDEHIRFYLLSLGCLEWLLLQQQRGSWMPDIIHAHDWHTGYILELIKQHPRYKKALGNIKTLYTIHNFKHQGNYQYKYDSKTDTGKLPLRPIFDPRMQKQNPLLRGILYADKINTVSRRHALEIQTVEFGEGLHEYLKKYAYKLSGIANGIDTVAMNPETDPHITTQFSIKKLGNRQQNKTALQKLFKLPVAEDIPVVSFVGRLSSQKGLELILKTLEQIEVLPKSQFIFLGSGEEKYYNALNALQSKFPTRIAALFKSDFIIPRKIFAGSDILLVPSRFEPGGIVAMEGLRYGCVPIVSDTGGLSETVTAFNPALGTGNGFLHERDNPMSFMVSLVSALALYTIPDVWKRLTINALSSDHSWDNTALHYRKLYKELATKV